jgi:hypothetical protein
MHNTFYDGVKVHGKRLAQGIPMVILVCMRITLHFDSTLMVVVIPSRKDLGKDKKEIR